MTIFLSIEYLFLSNLFIFLKQKFDIYSKAGWYCLYIPDLEGHLNNIFFYINCIGFYQCLLQCKNMRDDIQNYLILLISFLLYVILILLFYFEHA